MYDYASYDCMLCAPLWLPLLAAQLATVIAMAARGILYFQENTVTGFALHWRYSRFADIKLPLSPTPLADKGRQRQAATNALWQGYVGLPSKSIGDLCRGLGIVSGSAALNREATSTTVRA